jgi:ElaB/YqjD/DUF883 family membrane-anchored ribosome-binding protein
MKAVEAKTASTAESLLNAAGERAKSYLDVGVNAWDVTSRKARQIGRKTDHYVHDSPWLAIGAAAGAGVVLGFLFRGRRES